MTSSEPSRRTVEFKGRMMTLTVLRVGSVDLDQVERDVAAQLERMPGFFQNMPVLIETAEDSLDVGGLTALLRRHDLVPVALYQPSPALADKAQAAAIGVISASAGARDLLDRERAPRKRTAYQSTKTLVQPVRSGQQIYARGGDLIVLSSVSPGAEVLADGCIHIYGPLRGRALAGATGDENARVFCRSLEAELIAVAGRYRIAEDIDESLRGKAAQVSLQNESLIISALE